MRLHVSHDCNMRCKKGDIYLCHQFAGIEEFKIGNVNNGILNKDISESFKETNMSSKKSVINARQNFTAVAVVLQMHIILMKIFKSLIKLDMN